MLGLGLLIKLLKLTIHIRYLLASFVAVVLLGAGFITIPTQAHAASLTSQQISAIIGLLQSFGADQSVINNVSIALGGSSSALSCSTFADLTYGNFDTNPGGRVSQLQTWLGIPLNTFGFGTYGPRTRALWNSRCGGAQITPSTTYTAPTNTQTAPKIQSITKTLTNLTVSPTSGLAPLTVTFSVWEGYTGSANQTDASVYNLDFGDGQNIKPILCDVQDYRCVNPGKNTHTYSSAGTYIVKLTALNIGEKTTVGTVSVNVSVQANTGSPVSTGTVPASNGGVVCADMPVMCFSANNVAVETFNPALMSCTGATVQCGLRGKEFASRSAAEASGGIYKHDGQCTCADTGSCPLY